jgi:hypothetical protein
MVHVDSSHAPTVCSSVPSGQTFPHAPQFSGSEVRSTHVPSQSTRGSVQLEAHVPSEQTSSSAQALSHAPQ